jgi:hypothetical protein
LTFKLLQISSGRILDLAIRLDSGETNEETTVELQNDSTEIIRIVDVRSCLRFLWVDTLSIIFIILSHELWHHDLLLLENVLKAE